MKYVSMFSGIEAASVAWDGLTTCDGCRFQKSESCSNEMTLDVVERAKKLAGIEEEARND